MDADGNIIPIVEDDQGEGFKDEVPPDIFDALKDEAKALSAPEKAGALADLEARFRERIAERPDPEPQPDPQPQPQPDLQGDDEPRINVVAHDTLRMGQLVFLMYGIEQDGGRVHVFGERYRVSGRRQNGKLILKPAKIDPSMPPGN